MHDQFLTALASLDVDVVLEKKDLSSAWQTHTWVLVDVLPHGQGRAQANQQVSSAALGVFRDELEGYYLNMSTDDPRVFVQLRSDRPEDCPTVHGVTLSYNEAARWMDASERVESISMPEPMRPWIGSYVEDNYKPEPKKRRRPASFISPEKRDV